MSSTAAPASHRWRCAPCSQAPVWQRIADGTLQSISVGYRVHRYEQITDPATGQTVHRAVDCEPYEISVVPIPVDPAAAIRGEDAQGSPLPGVEPALSQEPTMPETMPAAPAATEAPPAPAMQAVAFKPLDEVLRGATFAALARNKLAQPMAFAWVGAWRAP